MLTRLGGCPVACLAGARTRRCPPNPNPRGALSPKRARRVWLPFGTRVQDDAGPRGAQRRGSGAPASGLSRRCPACRPVSHTLTFCLASAKTPTRHLTASTARVFTGHFAVGQVQAASAQCRRVEDSLGLLILCRTPPAQSFLKDRRNLAVRLGVVLEPQHNKRLAAPAHALMQAGHRLGVP